jgi:hypothetical protein
MTIMRLILAGLITVLAVGGALLGPAHRDGFAPLPTSAMPAVNVP